MSSNGKRRPIDPELISAFYDGETTAEERAAVEQWMDDSTDTLQTLDEYDQLSHSLKELHRSARSPDLRETVMLQVAGSRPEPASTSVRDRRRVLSIVAGLAGLAAAVTLMFWPAQPRPQLGDAVAINEVASPAMDSVFAEGSLAMDSLGDARGGAGPPAPMMAAAPTLEAMGESAADMEANVAMSLEEMARERPVPEVGDIVRYLDRNAEEITWVAVTVVDVQTAGNQVQLLLARHGVESPSGTSAAVDDGAQSNEPVAILVEADWNQMEAVIGDLSDEEFVSAMIVNAPPSNDVPEVLQGYAMKRNGELQSKDEGQELRMRAQARIAAAEAAELAKRANRFEQSIANSVQLQANVPDADLRRIAARRGADAATISRSRSEEPADVAAPSLADTDQPERIGVPLARPRAKAVFVIQTQGE